MNDFNIVTPDWIRQKLKETGKMQKELALEIATDPSRLSEWLNGKRGMTGPVRAAIWYYFLNEIYIVTAYRSGCRDNHSYNVGVFRNKDQAIRVADSHCNYRGGKYACVVESCIIDHFDNERDEYTEEIYTVKSRF